MTKHDTQIYYCKNSQKKVLVHFAGGLREATILDIKGDHAEISIIGDQFDETQAELAKCYGIHTSHLIIPL